MSTYKNHLICIYERNREETCVGVFETAQELADYLNTSLHSAYAILHKCLHKKQDTIIIDRKLYNLELVRI